jgi:hypothetical protein
MIVSTRSPNQSGRFDFGRFIFEMLETFVARLERRSG